MSARRISKHFERSTNPTASRGAPTEYKPGETHLKGGPPGDIRFPGQWQDDEDEYFYNWHRYYAPSLGRYITPDPIGLAGGFNMYSYVGNNPINLIDPRGLVQQFTIRTLNPDGTIETTDYNYYSEDDVRAKLCRIGHQTIGEMRRNHGGGGIYDFKVKKGHENDLYNVYGEIMTAAEFGNFAAGYAAYRYRNISIVDRLLNEDRLNAVLLAGQFYDASGAMDNLIGMLRGYENTGDSYDFDIDSWEAIMKGYIAGRNDSKIRLRQRR